MRLLARYPEIANTDFYTAVVCGDLEAVTRMLAADPPWATRQNGVPAVRADVGGEGDFVKPDWGTKGWEPPERAKGEPLRADPRRSLPCDIRAGTLCAAARAAQERGSERFARPGQRSLSQPPFRRRWSGAGGVQKYEVSGWHLRGPRGRLAGCRDTIAPRRGLADSVRSSEVRNTAPAVAGCPARSRPGPLSIRALVIKGVVSRSTCECTVTAVVRRTRSCSPNHLGQGRSRRARSGGRG